MHLKTCIQCDSVFATSNSSKRVCRSCKTPVKREKVTAVRLAVTRPTVEDRKTINPFPDLSTGSEHLPKLSNTIPGGIGAKKDKLTDHLWHGKTEKAEAIAKAQAKTMRIAQAYSKGANQYLSDDDLKLQNGKYQR